MLVNGVAVVDKEAVRHAVVRAAMSEAFDRACAL